MTRQEHLLTILSEECAEVIQAVSKALRFGLNDKEPGQKFTNSEAIETEIYDIITVITMLENEGCLNREDARKVESAIDYKRKKIEKYLTPGKIVIKDKVYFEHEGLEKPEQENYSGKNMAYFDSYSYHEAMKEYEASKQLIEVSNVIQKGHWWVLKKNSIVIRDGEHCKAEVTDKIATIIKIN